MSWWEILREINKEIAQHTYKEFVKLAPQLEKSVKIAKILTEKIKELMPETHKFLLAVSSNEEVKEWLNNMLWCSGCHITHPITSASLYAISFEIDHSLRRFTPFKDIKPSTFRNELLSAPYFYFPYPSCFVNYCMCPPDIGGDFPSYLSGWERKWKKDRETIKAEFFKNPSRFPDMEIMQKLFALPDDYFKKF